MWRAVAAAVAFAAAAGSGVLAAVVAGDKSLGWWVALGVLVTLGAILQGVVTVTEPRRRVVASGAGAVAIGGSAATVQTRVRGVSGASSAAAGDVVASAPGAVSIGGDVSGPVTSDVDIPERHDGR